MGFKDFRVRVAFRVILLGGTLCALSYTLIRPELYVTSGLLALFAIFELFELYRFIARTNRKLTRFLESVKYSDFVSGFSYDNQLGKSFKDLNQAFNEVLEAFRKARSEKEEHLQYLNTIVEHVSAGLLAFDETGSVELINATAKKFLKTDNIRNIEELIEEQSRFYKVLFDLPNGKSTLFRSVGDVQLSIHATGIILRGKKIKLVALQNIQPELQKKELEAWQNLTKVLRHEIMNSITPIASLTSTMKDILVEDLKPIENKFEMGAESVDDLQVGLETIENRSKGLIRFIDAYRDYTSIPLPNIKPIQIANLIDHIFMLMKPELRKRQIDFICKIEPEDLEFNIDEELIEQIIINLVKNSIEALGGVENAQIKIHGCIDTEGNPQVKITDNGHGIVREALDQIFVPFYSTKDTGSGIGLSLSRQIMQLHNGTLIVESELDEYTTFTLSF